MQDWPYDLTIIPTASEQNGYFKVVIEAIGQALPELKGKIKHIGFGMVSLSTGKMSSRKGNILSAHDLLELAVKRVGEIVADREGLSPEQKHEIAETVGIGAVKYAFLKSDILQNMTFDLEESVSFEGNSGPYLQYTYARIQSVLGQGEFASSESTAEQLTSLLTKASELAVAKKLTEFPKVLKSAAEQQSPHLVATFLFELAQAFNSFYKQESINSAETKELASVRRFLASKTAEILKSGLGLLGISTVEKM
jgi:arginyl-tRNA synthetase